MMSCINNYKDETYLRNEYLNCGRTIASIAKEHKVSAPTVTHWLKKYNIDIRHRGKPYHIISLSNELLYTINSHMLGDGYISLQKNGYSAAFRLTSKHSNYIDYVNNELKKFGYCDVRNNNGYGLNNQGYATCRLETNADRGAMLQLHGEWYKSGVVHNKHRYLKKLPNSGVEIDSHTTMIWFIEDGYCYHKSEKSASIGLSTMGYSYDEVSLLKDKLIDASGINNVRIRIKCKNQAWGDGAMITVERWSDIKDFISFMDSCPTELISCFGYKWGKFL